MIFNKFQLEKYNHSHEILIPLRDLPLEYP